MELKTFVELKSYLRNFTSWGAQGGFEEFDFGGAVALWGACLDCLRENSLEADLEDLSERLDEDQVAFLRELVRFLDRGANVSK